MADNNNAFNSTERKFLKEFLEELQERFGNDVCTNDFEIPNTLANRDFLSLVVRLPWIDEEEKQHQADQIINCQDKKLLANGIEIVAYLLHRIKEIDND